jgi:hypothetical protein
LVRLLAYLKWFWATPIGKWGNLLAVGLSTLVARHQVRSRLTRFLGALALAGANQK